MTNAIDRFSTTIAAVDEGRVPLRRLAASWTWLTLFVFSGAAWYGGSLAYALGMSTVGRGALWLIVTTGLSWCVFGPLLIAVTRKGAIVCAHACLVTMAWGIAVLAIGGIVNVVDASTHTVPVIPFNCGWVALSNVVMCAVLVRQLRSVGVDWRSAIALWVLGLDGTGAVMFILFRHLLEGGR